MKTLQMAKDLKVPSTIANQATCLVGIRGSGKTNSAGVIAEELLETSGKEIAEFVATTRVSVIRSLRHLRKNAQRRFVTDFCEELYHLKGKPELRSPLTVFIDEAPLFVPQKVMGEHARAVGAVEDLIARGRNAGFGVVLISQRMATINKDVTTQCDTILCHRLPSPQDRKAIADWFEENATVDELKGILGSLATLKNGEAWVWAPSLSIIQRTQIRLRKTFDSSATPQGLPKPPKVMTKVDLEALRSKLAASVERAKADDPKELRRQLAEKDKRINELERVQRASNRGEKAEVERPVLTDGDRTLLASLDARILGFTERVNLGIDFYEMKAVLRDAFNALVDEANAKQQAVRAEFLKALDGKRIGAIREKVQQITSRQPPQASTTPRPSPAAPPRPAIPARTPATGSGDVSGVEQRILNALAELELLGAREPKRELVAFLAGYSHLQSKGFVNALSRLSSLGFVRYPDRGTVAAAPVLFLEA